MGVKTPDSVLLGTSIYLGHTVPIHFRREDRDKHLFVLGASAQQRKRFIEHLAVQDIENGESVCVIDRGGDLLDAVYSRIPRDMRRKSTFVESLTSGLDLSDATASHKAVFIKLPEYKKEISLGNPFSLKEVLHVYADACPEVFPELWMRANCVLGIENFSELPTSIQDHVRKKASVVSFRTGIHDAEELAKHFEPDFEVNNLITLAPNVGLMRMSVGDELTRPFVLSVL